MKGRYDDEFDWSKPLAQEMEEIRKDSQRSSVVFAFIIGVIIGAIIEAIIVMSVGALLK